MNESTVAHNSKEFFIDGKMILIRPLESDEKFARQSYASLHENNDFTAIGDFESAPERDLHDYCADENENSMVYIAVSAENDQNVPLGLAMYTKNPATMAHEMGVLIQPDYVNTRLAFELTESLTRDASEHRVMTIYTSDGTDDRHMRKVAEQLEMSVRLIAGKNRRARYTMQVDKHPSIVMV